MLRPNAVRWVLCGLATDKNQKPKTKPTSYDEVKIAGRRLGVGGS